MERKGFQQGTFEKSQRFVTHQFSFADKAADRLLVLMRCGCCFFRKPCGDSEVKPVCNRLNHTGNEVYIRRHLAAPAVHHGSQSCIWIVYYRETERGRDFSIWVQGQECGNFPCQVRILIK